MLEQLSIHLPPPQPLGASDQNAKLPPLDAMVNSEGGRKRIPLDDLPPEERVLSKVDKERIGTGCWIWTASQSKLGYGRLGYKIEDKKRTLLAHRVVWVMNKGPIPDWAELDHLCRNPSCVNPNHLEPVTHVQNLLRSPAAKFKSHVEMRCTNGHQLTPDNTRIINHRNGTQSRRCRECSRVICQRYYDLRLKSEYPDRRGERNARSKLTNEDVREIRTLYAAGRATMRDLAKQFNVSTGPILGIVRGKLWTHVT